MSTLRHDDIEQGKGRLWPGRVVVTRPGSWADTEEREYRLDGSEFWDDHGGDGNEYGTVATWEIAERMVACWNAFEGVPTSDIRARGADGESREAVGAELIAAITDAADALTVDLATEGGYMREQAVLIRALSAAVSAYRTRNLAPFRGDEGGQA